RFLDNREAMDRLLADAAQLARASSQAERWQDKIDAAGQHLKAVAGDRDELSYERRRKEFDDLFYDVDVKTLSSVEASERCASEFDRELKKLCGQVLARLGPQSGSG